MNVRTLTLTTGLALILLSGCDAGIENTEPSSASAVDVQDDMVGVNQLAQLEARHAAEMIRVEELAEALGEAGQDDRLSAYALATAERQLLERILAEEEEPSIKVLLRRLIFAQENADALRDEMAQLRDQLPLPQLVQEGDTHAGLAISYLMGNHAATEDEARRLIGSSLLTDQLHPGMEVWHFYAAGVYGTAVTQGTSDISPYGAVRAARLALETERDEALFLAHGLQTQLGEVHAKLDRTVEERDQHEIDAAMARGEARRAHYGVASLRDLRRAADLRPLTRRLRDFPEERVDRDFLPKRGRLLLVTASEFDLERIRSVHVMPEGVFHEGEDYDLYVSPGGGSASLRILDAERFEGETFLITAR